MCVCCGRSCFLRSQLIAVNHVGHDFAAGKLTKTQAVSALRKAGIYEDAAKKMIKEAGRQKKLRRNRDET